MSFMFPEHTGKLDEEQETKPVPIVANTNRERLTVSPSNEVGGSPASEPELTWPMPSPTFELAQAYETSSMHTPNYTSGITGAWKRPMAISNQHHPVPISQCTSCTVTRALESLDTYSRAIQVLTSGPNLKTEQHMLLDTLARMSAALTTSTAGYARHCCSSCATGTHAMSTLSEALRHGL